VPTAAWSWNPSEQFATPNGAACFNTGGSYAYALGVISLQECLTPVLVVSGGANSVPAAVITEISWKGLRCNVEVGGATAGMKADLRREAYAEAFALRGPELHSDDAIDGDPLPPGQVWAISPGTGETGPSLYRIEVAVGPGSGVKILNQPVPPAFRESTKVGKQNVYAHAKGLVGDRDPRGHEYWIQLRTMDNDRRPLWRCRPSLNRS